MRTKAKWIYGLITVLLVGLLAACGAEESSSKSSDAKETVVKIGYQKGNTLNILKARGTLEKRLEKENIKVEWSEFPIGTALLEGLNTGAIDFGHASDANGVFSQASGKTSVYVASDTPYPKGVALVVKDNSPIKTVKDFKGKKIGVTKGGNMHYLLVKALEKEGLSIDDVKPIYYKDAAEGRVAFESGEIDVIGTWDPFLAVLESSTSTRTIVNGENLTQNRTFYFVSEKFVNNNPNTIKIILDELQKSDEWANTHTKEVATILSKELKLDAKPLEVANGRREFGVLSIDEEAVKAQQNLADTFYDLKLFPDPIDIKKVTKKNPDWYPESVVIK
ncbi:sulfonate ABC transporter substrate-binding protein [Peribacillus sp. V2I11]|uniref:sulfonate ABC transporter substrate-binding protein n=1 Tax=Peribacillus sp. V2I11 TaxID=3042277 RepID=UPI00278B84EC|nr:sulfonate ABC transporter substrate-binding protein [Peribacillus sp. V2I11]MDQ0884755.1 sulfonate transport system substrate-binding protein [Peribacillus sp. V2I11]